jgi:hypothetical protein
MNMLGQNIGGIADTVVKFATSMIPDQWDENGKAKHYKKLSKGDYKDAIETIQKIMTTTIDGISQCYDGKYKDIFKNGGLLGMGDTPAEKVLATLESVSKSIGGIADIVLQFATSQIPIDWDKEGNPIKYKQLTTADYDEAVTTISTIMTTLIDGISKAYNNNKSVFEGEGDNPVKKAIESLSGLGEFIGGIADSVIKLASNQVACDWNPETGAPIKYAQLESKVYTDAATTISTILTTMVEGIKQASAGTDLKEIEKAMEAFGEIGTLVAGIANGVIGIASLRVPDDWNEQGQPIHFVELSETAITDAGKNIKEVMLTMVDGIKEAHKKIKDEMSPKDLEEIIGVMTDIVNPISAATKIVSDLAVLRIPTRYNENGQPIDYRRFNVIDMVNCKFNVLKIVDALLESVTKAGDAAKTFEASGNLDDVLKTMTSITNVLSKCGDILKTFGTGEIPITNNEGNIIKTLYIDFESAKTRITELLTSLLGSVSSVAAIAKTTTADLDPVTTAMNSVVGLLEKIAKPLAYYGSGLFPKEIDKDGNVKSWVTIDFEKAGENIKTLLTAIIGVISEVKEKHGKLFTNENADAISDMLTNMLDTYNEFTPLITTIAEGSAKLTEIVANVKLTDTEKCLNLIKYFSDSVSLIKELNLISSISNIPGLSNNNKFNVQEIQDVVNNVQEVTKIVADASTKISPIVNQSQEIDIIKFGKIVNSLNGTLQLLKTFGIEGDGLEEVKVERDGILGFLGFKKKEMQPKYIKIDPKQVEIIDSLASVVEKLVKSTNLIQDFISTSRPIDIEKFRETLKYSSVVLQEVSDFIDAQGTFLSNKFNGMEYSSFNEILAAQLETVSGIVRITKESSNIDSNGLNSLQIATRVINEICDLASAPINFSEQEKTLNKYVKSINSLNTSKVDSLTKLLWSMNHLAYKMGNLDKFTKVLAEQISSVLTKLTMELKNAKETIKAAQKLQEAREKSINKSIENVKSLMSQSMTVEITQTSTGYGDEGEGTPGSISGDSSTGSPASGGAGGAGGSGTGGSDYAAPTANLSPTYSQVQQKLELPRNCTFKTTGGSSTTYKVTWN